MYLALGLIVRLFQEMEISYISGSNLKTRKMKKTHSEEISDFREMELSSSKLKKR